MIRTKFAAAVISALALGGVGAGVANAASAPPAPAPVSQSPTGHNAQSQQGDQNAPDAHQNKGESSAEHGKADTGPNVNVQQGLNVQQGNQNAPDTGAHDTGK
ncbi:MAG: hypothetical protein ACRDRN_05455 [Sciscionella sp.]